MLFLNDILTNYQRMTAKGTEVTNNLLASIYDTYYDYSEKFSDIIVGEEYHDSDGGIRDFYAAFDGITIVNDDGTLMNLRYEFIGVIDGCRTWGLRYPIQELSPNHFQYHQVFKVREVLVEDPVTHLDHYEYYSTFYGWGEDSEKLDALWIVSKLASVVGVNEVVQSAVSLAVNGQLTVSNLYGAIGSKLQNASGDVADAVNLIVSSISSVNESMANTGLVLALQQLYGGWKNASADDENVKIEFSSTDFSVSQSLVLPARTLVSIASSVLSVAASILSPILGVVVYGVGTAIGAIVDAIDANDSANYVIVSEKNRCHQGFAIPMIQRLILLSDLSAEVLESDVMRDVLEVLESSGCAKVTNGVYTFFIWYDNDERSRLAVEGYVNATCGMFAGEAVTDSFCQLLSSSIDNTTSTTESRVYVDRTHSFEEDFIDHVKYSLDNNNILAGAMSDPSEYQNSFSTDKYYKEMSFRAMSNLATLAYGFLCAKDSGQVTYVINKDNVDLATFGVYGGVNTFNSNPKEGFAAYLACWKFFLDNRYPYLDNQYRAEFAYAVANIVNQWIPFFREQIRSRDITDHLDDDLFFKTFISSYPWYNYEDVDHNADVDDQALTSKYHVYPYSGGITNGYVLFPTSRFSVWTKVVATSLVIAGTVIAGLVLKCKIKKAINYRAYKARQDVAALKKRADETGNYADWLAAYKANKRYNRFWGKLSGTSYDMNNSWIDYKSGVDVTDTLLNSAALANGEGLPVFSVQDNLLYKTVTGNDIPAHE